MVMGPRDSYMDTGFVSKRHGDLLRLLSREMSDSIPRQFYLVLWLLCKESGPVRSGLPVRRLLHTSRER